VPAITAVAAASTAMSRFSIMLAIVDRANGADTSS
jgi:hypothetical protein